MRSLTRLTMGLACLYPTWGFANEGTLSANEVTILARSGNIYWANVDSVLYRSDSGQSFVSVAEYPEPPHTIVQFPDGLAVASGGSIYIRTAENGLGKPVAEVGDASSNLGWHPTAKRLAAWTGARVWLADAAGEKWTSTLVSTDPSASLNGLVHYSGCWIAYGTVTPSSDAEAASPKMALWTSEDGAAWSPSPLPDLPDGAAFKTLITGSPFSLLSAVEDQGEVDGVPNLALRLWTSRDGTTWTPLQAPTDLKNPWMAASANGPAGVLLVDGTRLWQLTKDGAWKSLPPFSSEAGRFLNSGQSAYWLISDTLARTSKDGLKWSEKEVQPGWQFFPLGTNDAADGDPVVVANRRDSAERAFGPLSSFLLE